MTITPGRVWWFVSLVTRGATSEQLATKCLREGRSRACAGREHSEDRSIQLRFWHDEFEVLSTNGLQLNTLEPLEKGEFLPFASWDLKADMLLLETAACSCGATFQVTLSSLPGQGSGTTGMFDLHVAMALAETGTRLRLNSLALHFAFGASASFQSAEPAFRWLPGLHFPSEPWSSFASDHFFRSPAVLAAAKEPEVYVALLPDLDLLNTFRPLPHFLDLRSPTATWAPTGISSDEQVNMMRLMPEYYAMGRREFGDSPQWREKEEQARAFVHGWPMPQLFPMRLTYGLAASELIPHMYAVQNQSYVELEESSTLLRVQIGFGRGGWSKAVRMSTSYLWSRYGRSAVQGMQQPWPQLLAFQDYASQHAYLRQLPQLTVDLGDGLWALHNRDRQGAQYDAWENDVLIALGLHWYGEQLGNTTWSQVAEGVVGLLAHAPEAGQGGAFPHIFDAFKHEWRVLCPSGCDYTQRSRCDPTTAWNVAAMSVSAWFALLYLEAFPGGVWQSHLQSLILRLSDFLLRQQQASGAIPAWVERSLEPCKSLIESSTSAIAGAVFARIVVSSAMSTKVSDADKQKYLRAARQVGEFLVAEVLPPKQRWWDFEVWFSCSRTPSESWIDPLSSIPPAGTLSLQWTADFCLALHTATGEERWLQLGQATLSTLLLFQQVWSPSYLHGTPALTGGFGVLTTDGEWSDLGRLRFAITLINYFLDGGGDFEWLERAIAVIRSALALLPLPEHRSAGVSTLFGASNAVEDFGLEGEWESENLHHTHAGDPGGWSGWGFGAGGLLGVAAYLEMRIGSGFVCLNTGRALGVDGIHITVAKWHPPILISLQIQDRVSAPGRRVRVVFGMSGQNSIAFGPNPWQVVVNGEDFGLVLPSTLTSGLQVVLQ